MQQVTGLDNFFLCIDAGPATNAVIGDLLLLEKSDDPEAGGLTRVRARVAERLAQIPPLRRVASGLPVGINNTYLREVDVDIAAHVREVIVSPTGDADMVAVAARVAAVMEEPLAADRPMWELVVLRGLAGGRSAHLFRAHHGIVDGPTLPVVVDVLSDDPTHRPPKPATASAGSRRLPEFVDLLARGVVNSAMTPVRLLSIQGRTLQYLLGRTKHEGALALPAYLARMLPGGMSRPLSALVNGHQRMIGGAPVRPLLPAIQMQKTPFNGKLTERRSYVFSQLSADDVARAAARFQVTADDVVVAACAGALRRYMQRYGDVPDRPLILCMPASIRTGREKEPWATHLSMLFAEFPTNVDDPDARLRMVHDELTAARETFDALPMHILRDASRLMPLTMLNVSMKLLNRAPEWAPGSPWNVVVASVPVRSTPMRMCGARVVGQWPVGFLTPGVGLNVGVYGNAERVAVGICGCPDLMPDLAVLSDYVTAGLAEIVEAAQALPVRARPTPRRPRSRHRSSASRNGTGSAPAAGAAPADTSPPEPGPPTPPRTPPAAVTPAPASGKPAPRRPRVRGAAAADPTRKPADNPTDNATDSATDSATDNPIETPTAGPGSPATPASPKRATPQARRGRVTATVTAPAGARAGGSGTARSRARRSAEPVSASEPTPQTADGTAPSSRPRDQATRTTRTARRTAQPRTAGVTAPARTATAAKKTAQAAAPPAPEQGGQEGSAGR